jgi:DUF1365 family protein
MSGTRLFFGEVMHRRHRPKAHRLRYRLFWMLIDLEELPSLGRRGWFFSHNRFNLLSFHDRDHGDGAGGALRAQLERTLATRNIRLGDGRVYLFCMPRVFGYAFNPISVYFCHHADGSLAAIVYEVHNTFGERHSYIFDAGREAAPAPHSSRKLFHVSPFMGMDMQYDFRTQLGDDRISIAIRGSDAEGALINASLMGKAAPFTPANLVRGLLRYPLVTFKVTAAIHWHALRLWLKGVPVRTKPKAPAEPATPAFPTRQ